MTEQTSPEKQERPRIELVYAGRVMLTDGKLGQKFYEIVDEEKHQLNLDSPRIYGKFKVTFLSVGGVYSIEHNPESTSGSVYPGTEIFQRMWPDETEVDGWIANDKTVMSAKEAQRIRNKLLEENDRFSKILLRLHGMYLSLPPGPQKAAFITAVVNGIMRG